MNQDIIGGKWKEIKGKIRRQWGKITDDELSELKGTQEELIGLLRQKYGHKREEAEREIREFIDKNFKD